MKTNYNVILNSRRRFESIDIAKAFAIVLVVIGHFKSDYMPQGYDIMIDLIYLFHMPLFMFASGFLYQASSRPVPYKKFIVGKFRRLMVPYFTVSVLIIILKLLMSGIMPVDHPVTWFSFVEILYMPAAGYFLWFIWALWWMMVIIPAFGTPLLRKILFAASAILYFIAPQLPAIFCIDNFASMLIFFSGGTVMADYMAERKISSFSSLWQILSVVGFAALVWAILGGGICQGMSSVQESIVILVTNILGIAMSMTVAFCWHRLASTAILKVTYSLASASYMIYLLHTTFEGFAKGFLSKIHWFDFQPQLFTAWVGAAIVISVGVAVPWWLAVKVLNRWETTALLFGIKLKTPAKES